jgi:hypothetical protein
MTAIFGMLRSSNGQSTHFKQNKRDLRSWIESSLSTFDAMDKKLWGVESRLFILCISLSPPHSFQVLELRDPTERTQWVLVDFNIFGAVVAF